MFKFRCLPRTGHDRMHFRCVQSFECVLFGATALARLGDRCWAATAPRAGDWLRPFAALLLAAPPAHRMEVCRCCAKQCVHCLLSWQASCAPSAVSASLLPLEQQSPVNVVAKFSNEPPCQCCTRL